MLKCAEEFSVVLDGRGEDAFSHEGYECEEVRACPVGQKQDLGYYGMGDLGKGLFASIGFEINPYDVCVMNKKSSHGEAGIGIYVDDIPLTCSSPSIGDSII